MEFTDNGVGYTWELAGMDGAAFVLHPLLCKHFASDVVAAKKELRRNRDVVSMRTEWVESYRGELFRTHRAYVRQLQEMKQAVIDNLSPEKAENYKGRTLSNQRMFVWYLLDKGVISWKIGSR